MEVADSSISSNALRIACAGEYGVGSDGNPSGELVRGVIEQCLQESPSLVSEIIIDFTEVDYEAGDGPVSSVMPAVERGLRITYIVGKANREPMNALLLASGLSEWIKVVGEEEA